jgi:hypothetical protein
MIDLLALQDRKCSRDANHAEKAADHVQTLIFVDGHIPEMPSQSCFTMFDLHFCHHCHRIDKHSNHGTQSSTAKNGNANMDYYTWYRTVIED